MAERGLRMYSASMVSYFERILLVCSWPKRMHKRVCPILRPIVTTILSFRSQNLHFIIVETSRPPHSRRDRGRQCHRYWRRQNTHLFLCRRYSRRCGSWHSSSDGGANHHGEEDAKVLGEEHGDWQDLSCWVVANVK